MIINFRLSLEKYLPLDTFSARQHTKIVWWKIIAILVYTHYEGHTPNDT
jgi:hypothetical protein